jgi:hypothetical protein
MSQQVLPGRHFALGDHPTNFLNFLLAASPLREIQLAAAILNILINQPGNWCNAAVPGPDSFVTVMIINTLSSLSQQG